MNSRIKIDLLTIVFIIVLSYVFAVSANKNNNTQVLFIVFGLCIMVAHKVSYKILAKTETFLGGGDLSEVITNLNSFVNNTSNSLNNTNVSGSTTDIAALNTNLESIKSTLDNINANIGSAVGGGGVTGSGNGLSDRMSVESQHALQSYQIKFLQDQINKTNDLINARKMQENMVRYKPIKVYSSCAIVKPSQDGTEDMKNVNISQDGVTTPANSQILSTIGQNNNSNFLNDVLTMVNKANNRTITL
jgi:hypothetical protein